MIKKFIAIAASAALLLTSFVPAAMAEGSDLPVTGSDKPSDYTKVLFLEDYEGDTTPNKTTLEWKPNAQISISSDASGTVSTKEQGSFAVVQQPTQPNDSYFRMKYGADTAPVQATGVTVADLSRVQVSLDVCPMTDFQFPLRFYDKFSGSSTKGETLIVINKGGYLTFANTDVTYDCSLGQWLAIDVFLDFDADVYSVYVNGNEAVSGAALKILTECVESVGVVPSSINEGDTYCIYMDNFRIAVPGKFEVVSTTPSEGAIGVDVAGSVQFELSDAPVNLDESMVTVTGGTSELVYTVTQADGIISIDFDGGLEYSTQYTVTLSGDIADAAGRTLGEAAVVSFTTASAPSTAADYDTVIYTNDFESAPVGANLSESEINYRPENAAYEIVQEGDNKYYKFSPSDTSKRANSGNLETGYFLPATLADKPIRKVKIDLDIAVDVKDGGPATISTYYRGRVASGALNARYNFVEFTADKYYAATDKLLKQSYTAGDWIHFTIYANYESNLMSVYTDDGFAMENIPLTSIGGVDKFSQIRMTMEPGESTDSSIKLDNIVYTTTADIYEQIKNEDNPDEPPVMGSDKPIDYNKVLFFEDFEGDTAPDSANFDWKPAQKVSIVSDSSDTVSAKEQGSYVRIDEPTDVVDGYYRVKYGANTAPVQASGTKVADLSRMQISLDWCPIVARSYGIRFFDKFSDAAATKAETLINVNQDGTLTFPNSDVTYSYSMGRWMAIDTYLDFTTDKYSIYINGNKVVTEAKLSTLTECAEAVGATITAIKAGETYSMGLDNIRIAIPEKMAVTSATPANGADDVNVKDGVQLTLTNVPVNFDKSMVTVTGGTTAPSYTASIQDNVISVAFDGAMEFGTQYTVTLSGDIADDFGQTLGTDYTVTFTTSDVEFAASVPQFGSKVTASAFNPYDEAKTAALVVSVINADGSSTLYIDEKTVEAGATADFTADFDITSLTDGQTVIAYVTEDTDSLKPVRSMYASADGTAVFAGSTAAAATVDKAEIVGNTVKVEGKISAKEQQTVILTVSDEAGNAAKAVPLTTAADGSFTYTYTIDGMQPGKYIVSVTGFSITESNSVGYMYLNDETKNEINAAINGAADAAAVKAQMEKYKNELYLPEKYYCDNIYNVLAQQKPFADYDSMTEMIYKADSLLTELNNADWSKYTKLFADYEDIMLKGADKLDKYNGYSAIKQNAINQIIIESSPFASFAALCTAFDAAVKEYGDSSSSGGSGGGGSGGSGGSSSSSVGGGSSSYNVGTTQIAAAETLFADMSAAPWAQQHVTQLYTKGIVSAAVNYRPLDNITREEFVKMLVQLAGLTTDSSKPSFTDVNGSEWYVPYLAAAQKAGIVQGSDDGSFGIGKNITRQDMVVMAQRTVAVMNKALKLTNEAVNFADSSQISGYAASAVTEMQQAGVVSGMGNGCFEPTGLANRAQAAVVICNLINAME